MFDFVSLYGLYSSFIEFTFYFSGVAASRITKDTLIVKIIIWCRKIYTFYVFEWNQYMFDSEIWFVLWSIKTSSEMAKFWLWWLHFKKVNYLCSLILKSFLTDVNLGNISHCVFFKQKPSTGIIICVTVRIGKNKDSESYY